jgi:hypothetical protein
MQLKFILHTYQQILNEIKMKQLFSEIILIMISVLKYYYNF